MAKKDDSKGLQVSLKIFQDEIEAIKADMKGLKEAVKNLRKALTGPLEVWSPLMGQPVAVELMNQSNVEGVFKDRSKYEITIMRDDGTDVILLKHAIASVRRRVVE